MFNIIFIFFLQPLKRSAIMITQYNSRYPTIIVGSVHVSIGQESSYLIFDISFLKHEVFSLRFIWYSLHSCFLWISKFSVSCSVEIFYFHATQYICFCVSFQFYSKCGLFYIWSSTRSLLCTVLDRFEETGPSYRGYWWIS